MRFHSLVRIAPDCHHAGNNQAHHQDEVEDPNKDADEHSHIIPARVATASELRHGYVSVEVKALDDALDERQNALLMTMR